MKIVIVTIFLIFVLSLSAANYSANQFIGQSAIGYATTKSTTLASGAVYLLKSGSPAGIGSNLPLTYALEQNYPNPFNPVTAINYQLPADASVTVKIYNILGHEVATLVNGQVKAGYHTVNFNGSSLASGQYFYRIQTGDFNSVKKMLLLK